jgi:hypothetical protein
MGSIRAQPAAYVTFVDWSLHTARPARQLTTVLHAPVRHVSYNCTQHGVGFTACLLCDALLLQEAKFRHIRLGNEKIRTAVVDVAGALDFLAAVGFQVHAAEASPAAASSSSTAAAAAAGDDGGFAVFLDDKDLSLVEEGLLQLQQAALAQQTAHQHPSSQQQQAASTPPETATPTAAAGAAVACSAAAAAGVPGVSVPRETQVLLPAAPDTQVPDWFFERTGAELKVEYTAMVRRRQTGGHLHADTCT